MSNCEHFAIISTMTQQGKELPPQYNPQETESRIYDLWEKSGYFNPDALPNKKGESFTVILPPPNANAPLHAGHALGRTIEDILVRFNRMRGKKTLWLPGTDHAGFETQVVFEKKLEKEGRSRFGMERDEFYKEIWDFVQNNKHVSEEGLKRLGASCDWSRNIFTLDPRIIEIVYETFEKMYADGLIYKGERISNWCIKHQTTLSDLETRYEEREDPLYYVKYGPFVLATVRPETKFGDTAVAVNPSDVRYQKYIGKEIEFDGLIGPVKLKVIADDAVDPEFGTGVVKVTPAHDPADYEIWLRHKDEIDGPKQVIDRYGKLNQFTGSYSGMKIKEAREKIVTDMKAKGILVKVDEHYKHNVQLCYKCGTVIEPLIMPQWFVAMTKTPAHGKSSLRDMAVEAVQSNEVRFLPGHFEKIFMHWMENLRDWPISRQIWWGIRIPVWYCLSCGEIKIRAAVRSRWFLVRHGVTDWNKDNKTQGETDIPLNEEGRAQARAVAEKLKDQNIELIISSPLSRAKETADIIASVINAEVVVDPELREKRSGEAEGMDREEAKNKYGDLYDYDRTAPNGESYRELETRVWAAFKNHKEQHGKKNVLIVSHGGTTRTLIGKIRNLTPEAMLARPSIKNCELVSIDVLNAPCEKCGGDLYEQDTDTLDTWFSSGQWPYATLMANSQNDLKNFFPTNVLVTAADILFFWVARMIMFSYYRTGKKPFSTVLLHGLVRDKDRQKMSKSKGNVIDPLGIIDVYGTDALRFALIFATAVESDLALSEDRIRGMKHFANKLWNIARFVLAQTNNKLIPSDNKLPEPKTDADREILEKMYGVIQTTTDYIEKLRLHEAAQTIYDFTWRELADKYIEASKTQLQNNELAENTCIILEYLLKTTVKLLHPFMPFVTEEIWQRAGFGSDPLLVAEWPKTQ